MNLSKEQGKLLERLKNPRLRPREGQFIVEGVRGAREFLVGALRPKIRFALTSPRLDGTQGGRELKVGLVESETPLFELSDETMKVVSDTEQSQGVLLVVKEPVDPLGSMGASSAPRILIMDGIQDPGNAGTLIRAARAFGLQGVMAVEGTVDPFNPKVVRASAGALAHIPVHRIPWPEARVWLVERGVPLLAAEAEGRDVRSVELSPPWALAVGSEGKGPRPELLAAASQRLGIPMDHGVDSLNAGVAGAILLFALTPSSGKNTEN